MNDAQPVTSRAVRIRRLVVILLIVVIAVLAVRTVLDVWTGRRLKSEIAQLEKQYGPLAWDPVRKIDAWRYWPRRLAPENRARMLDAAAARVTLSEPYHTLLYLPRTPLTLPSDQARGIAGENRDAVQLAIGAARLPTSNWHVRFLAEPHNVPNLMDLDDLAKILAITARSATDAGRADDAVAAVTAGFAEAAAMGQEPAPIMTVNALSVMFEQTEVLKDILDRTEPSAPALATLAAAIDENVALSPAREALLGDLKHARFVWPWYMAGYTEAGVSSDEGPSWIMRGAAWLVRPVMRFMFARDLADKARGVEAASMPRSKRDAVLPPPSASGSDRIRVGNSPPAYAHIQTGDYWAATARLAATSVALRRFRLDRGGYPNALDELVPAYLKTLPLDPYTERQFEYKRVGAGFELRAQIPPPRITRNTVKIPRSNPAEWKIGR